jgi:GH15 family glucan-1,4-alpha-glucosidase
MNPARAASERRLRVDRHEAGDPRASIGDYAIIGDCRTAALISRSGSIDWLCLPHFSAGSVFGAILDPVRGGRFALRPSGPSESLRRYVNQTPVLETVFEASGGRVRITDVMTVLDGVHPMRPLREVIRKIEGLSGEVDIAVIIDLRPDYGRAAPRLQDRGRLGWAWNWGNEIAVVRSDIPLSRRGNTLHAEAPVAAGNTQFISLSYVQSDPAVFPMLGDHAEARLNQSIAWWRDWNDRCTYRGPHRKDVQRSAMTVQLLSYVLSGAMVAAPTTSLPEAIGGELNWDYRYCWLRDAGLTAQALLGIGYCEEARAFLGWLLHATRLTWPELQVLYDVYGRTRLKEEELQHLSGYRDSRPVRIGNAAVRQRQLDVYGEVVMVAERVASAGMPLDRMESRMLTGFGKTACKRWREPDNDIWERRRAPRHYTLSKTMCWAALDRLLQMHARGTLDLRAHEEQFRRERNAIRETIERRAFNSGIDSYVSELDGEEIDASLLLLSSIGYADAGDPRMRGTYARVWKQLARNGLLFRYAPGSEDGKSSEGAFGLCCFWAVENLAKRGNLEEAEALFEHLLGYGNDLGLYGEEIDVNTGAALGNFPQAFTHVGLINAALAIESARVGK